MGAGSYEIRSNLSNSTAQRAHHGGVPGGVGVAGGAAAGGGSLLDYLGYGATLGTWFMDGVAPTHVTSTTWSSPGLEVDEHSVTVLRYDRGLSVMQTRWGTHGDHWLIVLSPDSVPETFDITLRAYELSEKYRCPVIILMDEIVGHMREKIELPDDYSKIPQAVRKGPSQKPEDWKAYATDASLVPEFAPYGTGYRWHITGLVHDETGFPKGTPAATVAAQDRLRDKLYKHLDDIVTVENYKMEDAEFAVVAYGGASRSVYEAIDMARKEGLKVGFFRPITIWPFADKQVKELAGKVKGILVHELNDGQYVLEVERAVAGKVPVHFYGKYDNESATPEQVLAAIKKAMA